MLKCLGFEFCHQDLFLVTFFMHILALRKFMVYPSHQYHTFCDKITEFLSAL
jgi:hypothetical protein